MQIKKLNSSSSVNHRPMSETSDSSFVQHYYTESFCKADGCHKFKTWSYYYAMISRNCEMIFVFFEAIILIWPVVKKSFFISSSFNFDTGVGHFRVKKIWIASLKPVKFSSLFWSVLIIICETSFVWKILARVVILQFLRVTNSSSLLTGRILLHAMHDVDLFTVPLKCKLPPSCATRIASRATGIASRATGIALRASGIALRASGIA